MMSGANDTAPSVMLSPNAKNFTFDNCASFDTVTLNVQLPVRLSVSVAVHLTSVLPMGNVSPDCGEHETLTDPWPPVGAGVSKLTAMPVALTVARDTPSTHDSDGGSATGGGGGCVGVVGVLLHDAARTSAALAETTGAAIEVPERRKYWPSTTRSGRSVSRWEPGTRSETTCRPPATRSGLGRLS